MADLSVGQNEATVHEQSEVNLTPGDRVRIGGPKFAWYHGLVGTVIGGEDQITVELDDEREPRALVPARDLEVFDG